VIVLFNPQSTPSAKKPLPMSLLALASVLEGRHEYAIVDGNLESAPVARIAELARRKPLTAVGISVMPGPQLNIAVPQTRALKAALPGVPLVWGGYFPSQHDETSLADASVDFVIRGQGELTLLELAAKLRNGGDLGGVPGLSWKDNGAFRRNPPRELVPLDDLPDWPYASVQMERYLHSHYLGRRVGTHQSSYGCPFGCNFCAIVSIVNRRWLSQSPERLHGILRLQQSRYGIDAVQFHDMDFFVSEARSAEFAERITPLGLAWWALGRVDELMKYSDDTWHKLKRSGLKMVFCGAESGSDAVLKRMNKGGKASASLTLDLVRRLRSFGIVPELSFVLGNPPDPVADVNATLAFIRRLKRANPETEMVLYMYTPVPLEGTLYDEARALGFKFPASLDEWVSGDWRHFSLRREPHTPWLRPSLQRRIRNFERVVNAYYPTVTDTQLSGLRRGLLRALGSWRYRLRFYAVPLELQAFQKLVGYQRPETAGF
jgi:anaerobic magnesium-protoporphyrin IX monomethyl ester cyclase